MQGAAFNDPQVGNSVYFIYNLLLLTLFPVWFPIFFGKMFFSATRRQVLAQKLGFIGKEIQAKMKGSPRIWVHAVSMGEVAAVHPLIRQLRAAYPDACLVLSTGTDSGQKIARERVSEATATFYFPLDLPLAIRRAMQATRPDLCILAETELWPNFLRIAKKSGARTLLVNGRISDRSYPRYRRTQFWWRIVLDNLDALSMIRVQDGERAIRIGANPVKVLVNGNCKLDQASFAAQPDIQDEMRNLLGIGEESPVFVAGSTHEGEEDLVLRAFQRMRGKYPEMILILVPRHIERIAKIERILRQQGFHDFIFRSRLKLENRNGRSIILWDTFGELFKIYSIGTLVFCGGSLVPKRGQNILEPAAWGKMVFYGPSLEDFRDAHELLQSVGAGVMVRDEEELAAQGLYFLEHAQERKKRGEAGRQALWANQGATARNLALARRMIER